MSYLFINDYKRAIQHINLAQVLGDDYDILESWQRTAQAKAISYLTQKYDTEAEFTDTVVWNPTSTYGAAARVYFDAPIYFTNMAYLVGDTALFNSIVYRCIVNTTGPFDVSKWEVLGDQYALFYVTGPAALFQQNGLYKKGDQVLWKGKVYTALTDGGAPNLPGVQYGVPSNQYVAYQFVPKANPFPDAPNGTSQWGVGVTYDVTPGTLPTDTAFWTKGDNRSTEMVQVCSECVIYYIHKRISPQNIPILRKEDYQAGIQWLQDAGQGIVTPALIRRQPYQGNRIRWGGNIKNDNSY